MIVLIENMFLKCGICELPLMVISNVIATCLHMHNNTHKEYNQKYVVKYVVKWSSPTRSRTSTMRW